MNKNVDMEPGPEPLLSELGDDLDLRDLIEMFVDELPVRSEALARACEDNDLAALARLAHQLKGAAGGYGFPTITKAAADLEQAAKVQESLDRLRESVCELTNLCLRARAHADSAAQEL